MSDPTGREPRPGGKRDRMADAVWAVAYLARRLERACESSDISFSQYRILGFLVAAEHRAGVLAEKAAVSRPALTVALDALEQRGLIKRAQVPGDRRGVSLRVTRAGRAALARAESLLIEELSGLVLSEDRVRVVEALCELGESFRRRLLAAGERAGAEAPDGRASA